MGDKPSYYITTAISYPNGAPHIGHAYEAIATDALARFKRCDGWDVFFLTGTDEHGLKMKQTALELGIEPGALGEKNSQAFIDMVKALNCSNDDFIRTTEERHHKSCQEIWRRMAASGDIYLDGYKGWYSIRDEAYYQEGETTVGDDGVRIGPQGTPVEWTEEQTFFFKLSEYEDKLLAHYDANPDFILPKERRNEVVSFVKGGLLDLSISRTTFDWGVPVPDTEDHIMYVWVDALTNYITGAGFPDEESAQFKKFWPADLHIIGKDIIRFHAVYWPAFLMSAGLELPKRVYAHGMVLYNDEKMSKSTGNVLDPLSLAEQYGVDQLRYFLLREVPFGKDGNYNHEGIVNRTNADLANDLGNLAQRSLSMIAKNCGGVLPEMGELTDADIEILKAADSVLEDARGHMDNQAIHRAVEAIWNVVSAANRYFAGAEPWAHKKDNPARMGTILYVTAEVIRQVAILAQPFTPEAASKFLDQLAIPEGARNFADLGAGGRIASGVELPKPAPIFPRYVDDKDGA